MSYGRDILHGISLYAHEQRQWLITLNERGLLDNPPAWLKNWNGDGIISRTANPKSLKILNQLDCHQVELLGDGRNRPTDVFEDEKEICRLGFDHFLDRGITHYAFYAYGNCWWIQYRLNTYVELLQKSGIHCHVLAEKTDQPSNLHPIWDDRYEKPLIRWLRALPKPVGLMTLYDFQSALVIGACHKAGIAVPEEVLVLGTSNDEHICHLTTPSISSIDPNACQIGYEAARLLDLKMNKKQLPDIPVIVAPKGVVQRRSSDMIAVKDPDVVAALVFIRKNIYSGITVNDVVREVSISQSSLLRLFKKHFGRTPEQEICRLRITRAKELLCNTNYTISDIAMLSGFASPEYFVKVFKLNTGMTPIQYRKKEQKFIHTSPQNYS